MKLIQFFAVLITIMGCKPEIDRIIKQGYFDACKNHTVETLVENFFANPQWESFVSPDDNKYHLNATGQMQYDNSTVDALIQFELLGDDSWQINAFEINGEPQDDAMTTMLIDEMCSSASN